MKRKRYLVVIIILYLCISTSLIAQPKGIFNNLVSIDTNSNKTLFLEIDNINFFKNNEFSSQKIGGYTLPGFRFLPKLTYLFNKNILLEAGVSILNYWGANKYPCYSYLDIPLWQGEHYQSIVHILPYLRAQISFQDNLYLILGSLHSRYNHNLIYPLYNNELNLTADPESGVQFLYFTKYFNADLWLNWQSFIFKKDTHKEVFILGASSKCNIPLTDKVQIYIPIQYIAHHRGGELDTSTKIETWMNMATGIGFDYTLNKRLIDKIGLEFSYVGFLQGVDTEIPFDKGYGINTKLNMTKNNFRLELAYWTSKDFITILGPLQFINMATATSNLTYGEIKMIYSKMEYCFKKGTNYSLGFDFNIFHYFPAWVYRNGHSDKLGSNYTDLSFGIYLQLNPKLKIKSFD